MHINSRLTCLLLIPLMAVAALALSGCTSSYVVQVSAIADADFDAATSRYAAPGLTFAWDPESASLDDEYDLISAFEVLERVLVLPWNERFGEEHVDHIAASLHDAIIRKTTT